MLNKTGIKKETYGNVPQILFATQHQVSMGIVVDEAAGTADSTGRKIVKAGTPLTGSLDARTTAYFSEKLFELNSTIPSMIKNYMLYREYCMFGALSSPT